MLLSPLPRVAHPASPVAKSQGAKIYISADLEGVTGAVSEQQLGTGGFEYERFRRFMTDEVLAAIDGARAAGAVEILVSDSHGNGQNLLIDELPDDVMIVRSWPRRLGMMHGLDSTFDGAIFIGYHAGTTNSDGVRAHTMSSAHARRRTYQRPLGQRDRLERRYCGSSRRADYRYLGRRRHHRRGSGNAWGWV